jgi:hypothetical protein
MRAVEFPDSISRWAAACSRSYAGVICWIACSTFIRIRWETVQFVMLQVRLPGGSELERHICQQGQRHIWAADGLAVAAHASTPVMCTEHGSA